MYITGNQNLTSQNMPLTLSWRHLRFDRWRKKPFLNFPHILRYEDCHYSPSWRSFFPQWAQKADPTMDFHRQTLLIYFSPFIYLLTVCHLESPNLLFCLVPSFHIYCSLLRCFTVKAKFLTTPLISYMYAYYMLMNSLDFSLVNFFLTIIIHRSLVREIRRVEKKGFYFLLYIFNFPY